MIYTLLNLDNIMYKVKNLDQATLFYTDVLGLKQVWRDDERFMVGFKMPRGEAEIVLTCDPAAPNFDFSFLVEDVGKFCKHVREKGYSIVEEPFEVRCGKYAVIQDCDGNKIPIIDLTKFGGVPVYDTTL